MKEWIAAAQGSAVVLGGALGLGWVVLAAMRVRAQTGSMVTTAAAVGLPLFALVATFVEKKGVLTGASVAFVLAAIALRGRTLAREGRNRDWWMDAAALVALAGTQHSLGDTLGGSAFLAGGEKAAVVTRAGIPVLVAMAVRAFLTRTSAPNVAWAGALLTLLVPGPFAPVIGALAALIVGRHPGFVWLPVAFAAATAHWAPPASNAASRLIEARTPRGSVIYCDAAVEQGWTTRGLTDDPELGRILRRAFEARADRVEARPGFRAERYELDLPGAAEVRFFAMGAEIRRERTWRVLCPDAFDGSLVTACSGKAGVSFGREVAVDEVRVFGRRGIPSPVPQGLRRMAAEELKRRGVTHVLTRGDGALADELSRSAEYWGVEEIAEIDGTRIYRIR
jgi:hypothetical protein